MLKENEIIITLLENKKLLEVANSFSKQGMLKLLNEQLVYVDIDDRFIHELCPLIGNDDVGKPDYFSIGIGAHISVIYPNEKRSPIFPSNKIISFQIENLFKAETNKAIYFILTVCAPELIKIRHENNLGNQLNLNGLIVEMHTTIGKLNK